MQKSGKILRGRKDTLAPVVSTLRGRVPPSPPPFRRLCTQWNSGTTRESSPGPQVRILSALTTKPLSHTMSSYYIRRSEAMKKGYVRLSAELLNQLRTDSAEI